MNVIRKNMIVASATFVADDGSTTQPSAATLSVSYKDKSGAPQNTQIMMDLNILTQVWSAAWDTSVAGRGPVEWAIYGYGMLQAASEGSFSIDANTANLALA